MAKIFGLFTTAAAIIIALLCVALLDFQLHSFSLLFIIPVGSLALGALASFGYFRWLIKQGYKPSGGNYLFGLLLAVVTMFGIEYGEYMITYVSPDHEINYKFEGEHISHYALNDSGDPVTFIGYYSYKLDNNSVTISNRGNRSNGVTVDTSRGMSVASAVIQGLGYIIGSLACGASIGDSKTHCQSCKRAYLKEHDLFEVNNEDYESVMVDLNKMISDDNVFGFSDHIHKQKQLNTKVTDSTKYDLKIGQCPKCQEGYLIARYYEVKKDNSYEEKTDQRKVTSLSRGIVADTLKTLGEV